ncbi:MAG: AFG1 family ATPase [Gammaproteobacteria bacterium]|nr:AFG1 family ATPase [Gammaproteobacteria bacterium]
MSEARDLTRAYRASLQRHGYSPDPAQLHAVSRLDALRRALETAAPAPRGWLARAFGRMRERSDPAVKGLYLWGGVGRGKTFLMDLFHAGVGVPARRDHFHRFMKDVHGRLRDLGRVEDPLPRVAAGIAAEARVLCLDELFVSDIADAMILAGLFDALVNRGVTLVFTSNSPPSGLYRDGLQRARFLPAIALIERCCEVVNVDAGHDYRLRQLAKAPLYVRATDGDADVVLLERFAAIAGDPGQPGGELEVEGRPIPVRRRTSDVVWFDFQAICAGPRGASDYVEIARDHHTVFVSDVPVFDPTREDEARRFIALVDEFYDRGVKLVLSAAAPAGDLYRGERLHFEFERTRSRLVEMQSHEYLAREHRP